MGTLVYKGAGNTIMANNKSRQGANPGFDVKPETVALFRQDRGGTNNLLVAY